MKINPPQTQEEQPGKQFKMHPHPISMHSDYKSAKKLANKIVLITGGDSGIGRAVAYHCAAEGAKIAFTYYAGEEKDANETWEKINAMHGECLCIEGDLKNPEICRHVIEKCCQHYGGIDCLINNIAVHYPSENVLEITPSQLQETFATNVYSFFYCIQAALPHLKEGSSIINTTSVTAYRGSYHLIDYAATKGAIVSLTRSLSQQLVEKKIRVNAVAPGPVWTPLIVASFSKEEVSEFGSNSPMGKPAQPADIAPCYVFLASQDSAFMTGQVLHPNAGEIVNA